MHLKKNVFIYLSNAIDEQTKISRVIITDSPAATNKVIGITRAVNDQGWHSIILSLGRGRQNGSGNYYLRNHIEKDGLTFFYAGFLHFPFLTHIVTIFSLAHTFIDIYLRFRNCNIRLLIYNRSYHYFLTLIIARLMQVPCYLDLEDGSNVSESGRVRKFYDWKIKTLFNWLCSSGAVVATSSLVSQTKYKKPLICYGVANDVGIRSNNWNAKRLQIIFSGTLLEAVGSKLLIDAIEILKVNHPEELEKIFFVITGKGELASDFNDFAVKNSDYVFFGGAMLGDDYVKLLRQCHVGLSLRLSSYEMGRTTFPSKVIEYANNGLVVLSTQSPDIKFIFGDSALYLEEETPEALAKLIFRLPDRVSELAEKSFQGMRRVRDCCGSDTVGKKIISFFNRPYDG